MRDSVGIWRTRRSAVTIAFAGIAGLATAVGGSAALGAGNGAAAGQSAAGPAAMARVAQVYSAAAAASTPAPSPAAPGVKPPTVHAQSPKKLNWKVGFARRDTSPTPAMLAEGFHLGGFGLGPTRQSTGPAVDGDGTVETLQARAMAISNLKGETMLLAGLENQGTFAAYKQGPYGLWDIRQKVSKDTGVPADMIVINADHSHSGPDLIGLWGGVPVDYMKLVFDRTVEALDAAYAARVPAQLSVGSNIPVLPDPAVGGYIKGSGTPGENFVHSQFGVNTGQNGIPATNYDDSKVDTQLRVLQATDAKGHPLGTFINFSAHADVMGGGNLRYSADWPGRVARATEVALHEPVAVTMVADVGRSQPPRPHSDPKCDQTGHPSCEIDKLDTWTRIFTPWILDAVAHATPVTGTAVSGKETFTREFATNPALLGVSYSGEGPAQGTGAYRSITAPWVSGDLIGTFASAHRVGDLLFAANPGEAYPDIRFGVTREIKAPQAFFTFGLANDQLGYLIAPASEYGWISYSNVGNDNSFFNVSVIYGDHLYCTEKVAAQAVGFAATNDPQPYGPNAQQPNCPVLAASDGLPMGPAPQQPWVLGNGVALPAGT
jgi:hypothetical protein